MSKGMNIDMAMGLWVVASGYEYRYGDGVSQGINIDMGVECHRVGGTNIAVIMVITLPLAVK